MWRPKWQINQAAANEKKDWKDRFGVWIEIVKMLGLAAAGVWTIFIYLTLQRNFSDPNLPTLMSKATLEARSPRAGNRQSMILRVRHENLGKVDVRITHVVIRYFYGTLATSESDPIVSLNSPPAIGHESEVAGAPIQWRGITYDACYTPSVIENETLAIPQAMDGYTFSSGGSCGTGVVRANTTLEQVFELIYEPHKGAYVGTAAAFVFDQGAKEDKPRMNSVTAIAEAQPAMETEGNSESPASPAVSTKPRAPAETRKR